MADDKPVSGVAITGLTPALGQQVFVLRAQHREPLNLLEMTVDAGFGRNNWPGDGAGHGDSKSASRSIPGCLLFGAPIEPEDAVLLCVHFQPKGEQREESSPQ